MPRLLKNLYISLLGCLLLNSAISQEIVWLSADGEAGFINQQVFDIEQDSLGFMWFATSSGLYKFDGERYYRWSGERGINPFPGHMVHNLIRHGNNLWMLVDRRILVRFNVNTEKHTIIYQANSKIDGTLQECVQDDKHIIVASNLNRIIWFDKQSGEIVRRHNFIKNRYRIQCLHSNNNKLFLGVRSGSISTIDKSGLIKMTEPGPHFPFPGYSPEDIIPLNDSTILFVSWDNGLHAYNLNTGNFNTLVFDGSDEVKYNSTEGTALCLVDSQRVWIGTKNSGVYEYNLISSKINRLNTSGFRGSQVLSIFKDNKKRVWVGTDEGLNIYDESYSIFKRGKLDFGYLVSEDIDIHDLKYKNGHYLFATNKGVILTDSSFKSLRSQFSSNPILIIPAYSIIWDSNSEAYFGNTKSLFKLDVKTGNVSSAFPLYSRKLDSITSYNPIDLLSSRVEVAKILKYNNLDNLIISCPGYGIFMYEISSGKFFSASIFYEDERAAFLTDVYFNEFGDLCAIDFNNGIFEGLTPRIIDVDRALFDDNGDTLSVEKVSIRAFIAKKWWTSLFNSGLEGNSIRFIKKTQQSSYWVGTTGAGIYLFNRK